MKYKKFTEVYNFSLKIKSFTHKVYMNQYTINVRAITFYHLNISGRKKKSINNSNNNKSIKYTTICI